MSEPETFTSCHVIRLQGAYPAQENIYVPCEESADEVILARFFSHQLKLKCLTMCMHCDQMTSKLHSLELEAD